MAFLLMQKRVRSDSILAVTFTQHAALQLESRVRAVAGRATDGAWLGTFDSLCLRMLREHRELLALPEHFGVATDEEQRGLLRELLRDDATAASSAPTDGFTFMGGATAVPAGVEGDVHRQILRWKERGLRPSEMSASGRRPPRTQAEALARRLYPRYQQLLWRRGMLDFSDLVLGALCLFDEQPHILDEYRRRFRHILVDELQDTSSVQFEWLRRLAGVGAESSSLFCAADDDQSIFSWRGGDRSNVLRFMQTFENARVIRMTTSYRCPPHSLAAARAMLIRAPSLVSKSVRSHQPVESAARVVLRGFWDSNQEASWLAEHMLSRRRAGALYSEMAVLVRSQELVRALEPQLRKLGVPVSTSAPLGQPWYEVAEVRATVAALRVVRSSADDEAARELLVQLGGLTEAELAEAERDAEASGVSLMLAASRAAAARERAGRGSRALERLFLRLAGWQRAAKGGAGVGGLVDLVTADYPTTNQEAVAAVRRLRRVSERHESLAPMLGHMRRLQLRVAAPDAEDDAHECVRLLTIHRSKGLEWDAVYLPGWEAGSFPQGSGGGVGVDGSSEEEWRLAHVALTRCRSLAAVSYATRRLSSKGAWLSRSPSPFVLALPAEHVAASAPTSGAPYLRGRAGFKKTTSALLFPHRRESSHGVVSRPRQRAPDAHRAVPEAASTAAPAPAGAALAKVMPVAEMAAGPLPAEPPNEHVAVRAEEASVPEAAGVRDGDLAEAEAKDGGGGSVQELQYAWVPNEAEDRSELVFAWSEQSAGPSVLSFDWVPQAASADSGADLRDGYRASSAMTELTYDWESKENARSELSFEWPHWQAAGDKPEMSFEWRSPQYTPTEIVFDKDAWGRQMVLSFEWNTPDRKRRKGRRRRGEELGFSWQPADALAAAAAPELVADEEPDAIGDDQQGAGEEEDRVHRRRDLAF